MLFLGLKTALVEKNDFSSGTSSRSTKLIHGGVRYLQVIESMIISMAIFMTMMSVFADFEELFPYFILSMVISMTITVSGFDNDDDLHLR